MPLETITGRGGGGVEIRPGDRGTPIAGDRIDAAPVTLSFSDSPAAIRSPGADHFPSRSQRLLGGDGAFR